ncbi:hypothetical protein ILYODFUR_017867 [Ilyodon furcidens]|uniref:Uncharacterized protein n=3 Tax=Goodeidae TaxID=28758 RepID=A0ABU7AKA9_9TELE|nr:hypothetical protein [Ataeniobius toweri]MED6279813.1 hypothetical protein [Characodon lateralis]
MLKSRPRKYLWVCAVSLTLDTKNCEIREKDSAQNNCKPLLSESSISLRMGLRLYPPGCRTLKQRTCT